MHLRRMIHLALRGMPLACHSLLDDLTPEATAHHIARTDMLTNTLILAVLTLGRGTVWMMKAVMKGSCVLSTGLCLASPSPWNALQYWVCPSIVPLHRDPLIVPLLRNLITVYIMVSGLAHMYVPQGRAYNPEPMYHAWSQQKMVTIWLAKAMSVIPYATVVHEVLGCSIGHLSVT